MSRTLAPDVEIPPDAEPAARCPYCDRPFDERRARDLHVGEQHDDLEEAEREAYEAAREAERDELFFFHIKTVVALGVLYASTVILYMVAIQSGFI
ncbi:MAG: DNA-binding protein [Haloarculaceae archaeon]